MLLAGQARRIASALTAAADLIDRIDELADRGGSSVCG